MENDNPGFEILFDDGPCLVVSKPGGLLTQAPSTIDSLERRVKEFLRARGEKQGRVYLGVPHRLDRPTAGVLVLATHRRAARRISDQFAGRTVRKVYWAVVEGVISDDTGSLVDHIRKVPDQAHAEIVPEDHPDGRKAVLHFRVLARNESSTWVEIELETGRMHQIRLQFGSRGHVVLGDFQYGSTTPFGVQYEDERLRWIALLARELEFNHPMNRAQVICQAPLPPFWQELDVVKA